MIGLIPASAGQTLKMIRLLKGSKAHPRECGADFGRSMRWCASQGSSPRVRGRPTPRLQYRASRRLIPASAGQTYVYDSLHLYRRAHPRECGADLTHEAVRTARTGSSPRVRGRHTAPQKLTVLERLIPASAGQTVVHILAPVYRPAHPRECGADKLAGARLHAVKGSSPRVRGRR